MTVHLKLYGSKAERFLEIKEAVTEDLGYEPSNPEVVGVLMANYQSEDSVYNSSTTSSRASRNR